MNNISNGYKSWILNKSDSNDFKITFDNYFKPAYAQLRESKGRDLGKVAK